VAQAFGRLGGLGIAAQLRQPVLGTVDADRIVGGDRDGIRLKFRVADKPERAFDTFGLSPRHDLGAALMAVAAQRDAGIGPVRLDASVQPLDNRPQQFIQLGLRSMLAEQKEVAENDSGQSLLPPVTLVGESHRNGERAKIAFWGVLGFSRAGQSRSGSWRVR